jgi:hypothetical protein
MPMQAQKMSTALFFFYHRRSMERMVNATPQERASVQIVQEAGWDQGPMWMGKNDRKFLALTGCSRSNSTTALYTCPSASADELWTYLGVAGTQGNVCSSTELLLEFLNYRIFCVFTDTICQMYLCARQSKTFYQYTRSVALTVLYLTTRRPAHIFVSQFLGQLSVD